MKTLKQYSILAFLSFCICTSCTENTGMDEMNSTSKGYLEVFGSIGEGYSLQTRADDSETEASTGRAPVDEYYSFKSTNNNQGGGFVNYCKIGIYSLNSTAGVFDNTRLANTPLTYYGGSFKNEDIDITSMTNLGRTFAYYPYSSNNPYDNEAAEGTNDLRYPIALEYGKYDPNKISGDKNRVIDLLIAKSSGSLNSQGKIYYSFTHACSMLMIYRGDGFVLADRKSEENDKVVVKLKEGKKASVSSIGKGDFKLFIEPDDEAKDLIYPTNVYIETINTETTEQRSVNTVILPPGAEIEYIIMTDMFGTKQYIYPEDLLKPMTAGKKQPVTVKLDGLEPTIFPHNIIDWEDVVIKITDTDQNPGIYSLDQFNEWINAYNNYAYNNYNESELDSYGKKEGDKWTFHIYSDIDFSDIDSENQTTIQSFIPDFKDKLEGHGHTLKNISLQQQTGNTTTDTNFGFVGNLNGGSINNLKIDGISVTGSVGEDDCVGTIAGTVTSGSITNCKITGINIECEKGFAGALAGNITAGTIETCLLEGNLKLGINAKNVSDDNSYKLFGKIGDGFEVSKDVINTVKVNVFQSGVESTTGTDAGTGDSQSGE